jgi:ribonuclease R
MTDPKPRGSRRKTQPSPEAPAKRSVDSSATQPPKQPATQPDKHPAKPAKQQDSSTSKKRPSKKRYAGQNLDQNANQNANQNAESSSQREVGTLNIHQRGFGFVTTGDAADLFVPPKQLDGFLSGDRVTFSTHNTEARDLKLHHRAARIVMCDVLPDGSLVVDRALGNLTVKQPKGQSVKAGSCALVDLESARVIRVFKDPLSDDAVHERVLARHRIPRELPNAAAKEKLSAESVQRRDLTDVFTITIDDDSSEDLDDALSVQLAANGDLRVLVHIADVSSVVTPGSAIDKAASEIPTSVYLPNLTRHMLPRSLAAGELSLLPEVVRPTLTVEMLITQEGLVRSFEIFPSTIYSNQRISYRTAAGIISGKLRENEELTTCVELLHAAAMRLGVQRQSRGGVDAWRFDAQEKVGREWDEEPAHQLVERLMVATNEAVATWLNARNMPAVFRVHDELDETAVAALNEEIAPLRVAHPLTPQAFSALAAAHRGSTHEAAFWDAVLKVLPKARYQVVPGQHFGLGSNLYLHFTSPLRRYADLLTHRIVHAYISGVRDIPAAGLVSSCVTINDVARRAELAERDCKKIFEIRELSVGEKRDVVVLRRGNDGYKVRIHGSSTLASLRTREKLRPHQRIEAVVSRIDAVAHVLELEPARKPAAAPKHADKTSSTPKHPRKSAAAPKSAPVEAPAAPAAPAAKRRRRRKSAAAS